MSNGLRTHEERSFTVSCKLTSITNQHGCKFKLLLEVYHLAFQDYVLNIFGLPGEPHLWHRANQALRINVADVGNTRQLLAEVSYAEYY